jgi:acetyl-CoA acetyltransferase
MMNQAFICDAVRTPFGRFGGTLATMRADDLAALPLKALLERNPGLDPARIDDVIYGCANQAGEDNRNVARMALLLAGLPEACRAAPSTACAVPALMRSASQRGRLKAAKLS